MPVAEEDAGQTEGSMTLSAVPLQPVCNIAACVAERTGVGVGLRHELAVAVPEGAARAGGGAGARAAPAAARRRPRRAAHSQHLP